MKFALQKWQVWTCFMAFLLHVWHDLNLWHTFKQLSNPKPWKLFCLMRTLELLQEKVVVHVGQEMKLIVKQPTSEASTSDIPNRDKVQQIRRRLRARSQAAEGRSDNFLSYFLYPYPSRTRPVRFCQTSKRVYRLRSNAPSCSENCASGWTTP